MAWMSRRALLLSFFALALTIAVWSTTDQVRLNGGLPSHTACGVTQIYVAISLQQVPLRHIASWARQHLAGITLLRSWLALRHSGSSSTMPECSGLPIAETPCDITGTMCRITADSKQRHRDAGMRRQNQLPACSIMVAWPLLQQRGVRVRGRSIHAGPGAPPPARAPPVDYAAWRRL